MYRLKLQLFKLGLQTFVLAHLLRTSEQSRDSIDEQLKEYTFKAINDLRADAGIPQLTWNSSLKASAEAEVRKTTCSLADLQGQLAMLFCSDSGYGAPFVGKELAERAMKMWIDDGYNYFFPGENNNYDACVSVKGLMFATLITQFATSVGCSHQPYEQTKAIMVCIFQGYLSVNDKAIMNDQSFLKLCSKRPNITRACLDAPDCTGCPKASQQDVDTVQNSAQSPASGAKGHTYEGASAEGESDEGESLASDPASGSGIDSGENPQSEEIADSSTKFTQLASINGIKCVFLIEIVHLSFQN